MGGEAVRIYDISLRDGLRNSGIAIDLDDKVRFVQQLERLGVSDIEAGFADRPRSISWNGWRGVSPSPSFMASAV